MFDLYSCKENKQYSLDMVQYIKKEDSYKYNIPPEPTAIDLINELLSLRNGIVCASDQVKLQALLMRQRSNKKTKALLKLFVKYAI